MTSEYTQNGYKVFSLEEHDKKFHKNGYKEGDTCKFREKLAEFDKADDLSGAASAHNKYKQEYGNGFVPGLNLKNGATAEDVLSGQQLEDAMQDYEIALQLIDDAKSESMKKALQPLVDKAERNLEDAVSNLKESIKALGVSKKTQFGPHKPLAHDENKFPDASDSRWIDRLTRYGGNGWHATSSGSTMPHWTEFNGKKYFVKMAGYAHLANPSVKYLKDACKNEVNANNFLRLAGIAAPDSKLYEMPFGTFCAQEEADLSRGTLASSLGSSKIKEKAADAYPIMALLYNMDVMENSDNAYVDANNNPLFLDNGSTFGFSAQGARNKYFDFDKRNNPFPSYSTDGGLMGLLDISSTSARNWSKILDGKTTKEDVLKLCAKYDMEGLVNAAEKEGLLTSLGKGGIDALKEYAKKVDDASDKYKTKTAQSSQQTQPTQQPTQSASSTNTIATQNSPWSNTGINSYSNSTANGVGTLAQKAGISTPTITKNANGTITIGGSWGSQQGVQSFVQSLNNSGLFPGMTAMVMNGQVAVVPTPTALNLSSALNLMGHNSYTPSSFSISSSNGQISFGMNQITGSSSASSWASLINSNNMFPGYTATPTQNQSTGAWQVVLTPNGTIPRQINAQQANQSTTHQQTSSTGGANTSSTNTAQPSNQSGGNGGPGNTQINAQTSTGSTGGSSGGLSGTSVSSVNSSSSSGSSSGSSSSSSSSGSQSQMSPQQQASVQKQAAAIKAMPKSKKEKAISALKRRAEDTSLPQSRRDAFVAILKAVDPSYNPQNTNLQSGTSGQPQNQGVPQNPFGNTQNSNSTQSSSAAASSSANSSSGGQTYSKHASGGIQDADSLAANPNAASLTTYYPSNKAIADAAQKIADAYVSSHPNTTTSKDPSGYIRNLTDIFDGVYAPSRVANAMSMVRAALPNTHPIVQAMDKFIQTGELPKMSKSWTKSGNNGKNILAALNKSGVGYRFGSGQWVPAKRSAGGVLSGITIPRKGVRGVVNAMNNNLAPLGLKARIVNSKNGDGDIIISTSNKTIAAAALSAAGIANPPSQQTTQGTQPQTNTTSSSQQINQQAYTPQFTGIPQTTAGKRIYTLINDPRTTPAQKIKYQQMLDAMAKSKNGNI